MPPGADLDSLAQNALLATMPETPVQITFDFRLREADLRFAGRRVPPGVPLDLAPPPALLWAALGVFRPDAGLRMAGGRDRGDGTISLSYGGEDGQDLRFRLANDLLLRAEIREDGHLIEEVDLELDESSQRVVETVYRNRALFVELTFTLKSEENVESFPPDIWYPGW